MDPVRIYFIFYEFLIFLQTLFGFIQMQIGNLMYYTQIQVWTSILGMTLKSGDL